MAQKGDFISSIGDFVTKDVFAGLKVALGDVVHLGHVIGAFLIGGALPFFMTNIFPTLKGQLMIDAGNGGLTPAGIITALTSATLTAIWTLALKAPANSIVAQVATNLPEGAVTTEINTVSTQAGTAIGNVVKKLALALLIGSLLVGSAYANPIGVPLGPITQNGQNMWVACPFSNINTYTSNGQTNYGLGVAYGIAYANIQAVTQDTVNISPFFFIAPYASVEIANWINSDASQNISIDYGLMIGLPKLDSSIPEISVTVNKNSTTGSATNLGIATSFPTDILSDVLVRKLNL